MKTNKLSAMEVELKLLQISTSIEVGKLNMMYDINDIPEEFHTIYQFGGKLNDLVDELGIEYAKESNK